MRLRSAVNSLLLAFVTATAGSLASAQSPISPGVEPNPVPAPSVSAPGGLTAELFYRLLVGDVALQRGEPALAARAYFEAARSARDPKLARRAAEIAMATRQRGLAENSARLWRELDPTAERPQQILASLAAGTAGKETAEEVEDAEIRTRLEKVLADAAASGALGDAFLQLNRLFAQQDDKGSVYRLIRELAKPYPASPEAQFAVALAAFTAGSIDAEAAIDRAVALRPEWERAALLKGEILARRSKAEAIAHYRAFLAANPDSRATWGALAQVYVEQKRFAEARDVFQRLWDADRSLREYQFGVAVLSFQMKDYERAEALFADLKKVKHGDNGAVELYLAQISEETKRYDEAIARYREVPEGDRAWLAKLRIAAMMAKQDRVDDARRYLADLPAVTIEQRVQVRQAEAQLLRDAGDNGLAHAVLALALVEHPDQPDLLYDIAMVEERLDLIGHAEEHLKRLVELKPDDAQALNALGYTLVDRTARIEEGYALIEKAHRLAPDDPFILDSMGWAMFRMGRLEEAERYLKRAFAERPDAEIAAHLGEVLWKKGEHDSAREVWRVQLQATPDNPLLLETMRRLAR